MNSSAFILSILTLAYLSATDSSSWPCLYGINGNAISNETGLLKEWPKDGPTLVWTAKGLGKGYGSIVIADDNIFAQGVVKSPEAVLSALDLNGKPKWSATCGHAYGMNGKGWVRRYSGCHTTPTYADGRVFSLDACGLLIASSAKDGKPLWNLDLKEKYDVRLLDVGITETPLVIGTNLIVSPSGIIINTLLCGQDEGAAKVWRTIAHLSEGTFDSVDQSGGAITISTPMDATLAALSVRLDATRLTYGDAKVQKEVEKRKLDSAALVDSLSPSSVAERAAFNAKDAGMVNFAGPQELVSDWQDKKVKIEELPKEQLPPAIRDLAPDIQKETLERLAVERTKVQKEILVLDRQRQEYIQQALAKQHVGQDSFDMRMRQAMTTQAKAKNIDISSPVLNEPSKIK